MHVKQRIAALTMVAALSVSLFSACSSSGGKTTSSSGGTATASTAPQATKEAATPTKVDTVSIWTGEGHTKDLMTTKVEEFNNTTGKEKGIKIDYRVYGSDYKKVLDLAIQSGQSPDLFLLVSGKSPYITAGDIIPFEELAGSADFLKPYKSYLFEPDNIYQGKTYLLPYALTTVKLVYNKDLFKKAGIVDKSGNPTPPKTWDEVAKYAKMISDKGAGKEFGFGLPMKWGGFWPWYIQQMFTSSVGHMFYDISKGKYDFTSYKPAMEWLLKIKQDNSYFPGPEGLDNDPARAQFSEGKIGMMASASWDVGVYHDQFPAKIDWGVTDVPVLNPQVRYKEFAASTLGLAVGKKAKSIEASKVLEVLKWYHSDTMLANMYEESKYIPYKPEIVKLAKKEPVKKGWKEFANVSVSAPARSGPDEFLKVEGDNFKAVMEKIWFGKVSIDEGLADLDKRYNAAKDKAVSESKFDPKIYIDPNYNILLK